ncbi:MAG: helix-turn-helix domain-containing protein, partial [Solirubrobacteraceae bacterium]
SCGSPPTWPLLFGLAGRGTRRGRTLGALALTRTMRRTDARLLFLLSLLAARWGRVRPDGMRLSLPASHELLAKLIGTRRQAVTTALSDLRSRGLITILPDGDWLLSSHPPPSEFPHTTATQIATSGGVNIGEVNLLHADRGLAGVLSPAQLIAAQDHTRVRTQMLAAGSWDPIAPQDSGSDWLGLLVLDGFLSLETSYGPESALEIVGPGDLVRPWDDDLDYLSDIANSWRALTPTTVALLDAEFAAGVAPWTALTAEILGRAARRARWLTARLAISQQIHIRDRILYLFARLASRWGSADRSSTIIPVPLTHEQIAKLIGAQRPSVTIAVGELRQQGLLTRLPDRTWCIPDHDLHPTRPGDELNSAVGG